jgi:hypothetical protein
MEGDHDAVRPAEIDGLADDARFRVDVPVTNRGVMVSERPGHVPAAPVREYKTSVGIVQSVVPGLLVMTEAAWLVVKYERNICRVGSSTVGPPSPCTDSLEGFEAENAPAGLEKRQNREKSSAVAMAPASSMLLATNAPVNVLFTVCLYVTISVPATPPLLAAMTVLGAGTHVIAPKKCASANPVMAYTSVAGRGYDVEMVVR